MDGAENKYASVQQIWVQAVIAFIVRKTGPIHLALVGFMAGRPAGCQAGQLAGRPAGWQADETWVDFKIFIFSTGQTIGIFTSFNNSTM